MEEAERLAILEKAWLDGSVEEQFRFKLFPDEPVTLRRSKRYPGALSHLTFGRYQNFEGQWIDSVRAVHLDMIVTDRPGSGDAGNVLGSLAAAFRIAGITMVGNLTSLEPLSWPATVPFDVCPERLIGWYRRLGFKIIEADQDVKVISYGHGAKFRINISIE